MGQTFIHYIGWLLGPFFRWWWAAITGIVGLIAFSWTPSSVEISKPIILLLLLLLSATLFLTATVAAQGWKLYSEKSSFRVISLNKVEREQFDCEWIVIFEGPPGIQVDWVLQVDRRFEEGVVSPFAVIRVLSKISECTYQAASVWHKNGFMNDYQNHRFTVRNLAISTHPSMKTLEYYSRDNRSGQANV